MFSCILILNQETKSWLNCVEFSSGLIKERKWGLGSSRGLSEKYQQKRAKFWWQVRLSCHRQRLVFSPHSTFFALIWTSSDCMLIKYCWNRATCWPFNSRKCLHDLFSLVVFGAYMQVLYGRELLISATTEGTPFLSQSLFAWKLEKVEVRPCLELFLRTGMEQNFIFDLQLLRSCFNFKISAYSPLPRLGADNQLPDYLAQTIRNWPITAQFFTDNHALKIFKCKYHSN